MIPLPPDPWKVLGIEKTADKAEIRTAYKKLVLKTHPDKVQDPELKAKKQDEFQKVQQAYELLNDDAERIKYEEQVQLMELRRQAALLSKNAPNSSAVRSSSKVYYEVKTAEIRTAEPPRHKSSSGGGKVYEHYSSPHTRSHEEMPSRIFSTYEDGEKHARRTASYEKPSRREEEKQREKEDRRRKREEEDTRIREKDRERKERETREREREARKAEKKRIEKEREIQERLRDRERRRGLEEKSSRHTKGPYIEEFGEFDEVYPTAKVEKKRSSSKKHGEFREREREKSTSRLDIPSPAIEIIEPTNKTKDQALKETAADYIARSRGGAATSPGIQRSQTAQEHFFAPQPVPTPPPVEFEEESIRRSAARAAGRRSSHDSPKEKGSSHKQLPRDYHVVDTTPPKMRPVPTLSKSHSTPPVVPGVIRSNTLQEPYAHAAPAPPAFTRSTTWAHASDDRHVDYYDDYDELEGDRRHRHRSRRTRSPENQNVVYTVVDRTKTSKPKYVYEDSPSSRRYPEASTSHGSGTTYSHAAGFRVKESRAYGPEDVSYASVPYSYTSANDQYTPSVYA
ncbi:hypothetical protein B0H66DRAFT_152335 [Apodospora peruviana]|uniref:J domain-containing protein n=1 Tax=Apodospora peruviana TaxID=516989 RepID=A0AAE0IJR4_9PEZI|nr:hypothetical protein B0H66DRAFT_152335 [Apodospora peruviana]